MNRVEVKGPSVGKVEVPIRKFGIDSAGRLHAVMRSMLVVYEKMQAHLDTPFQRCESRAYVQGRTIELSRRWYHCQREFELSRSSTARAIDPELASKPWIAGRTSACPPICNAVASPSPYLLDVAEDLTLIVNVAITLTLADPVLHQIPVFYEGSGENSRGDGDTGIDLDVHSAAEDNIGDFLRVRGFPFGGGGSGCELESPSEGLLLPTEHSPRSCNRCYPLNLFRPSETTPQDLVCSTH